MEPSLLKQFAINRGPLRGILVSTILILKHLNYSLFSFQSINQYQTPDEYHVYSYNLFNLLE